MRPRSPVSSPRWSGCARCRRLAPPPAWKCPWIGPSAPSCCSPGLTAPVGGGERDNGINTADMTNVSQRLEVVGKRESKDLRCNVGTDSVLYETRPECWNFTDIIFFLLWCPGSLWVHIFKKWLQSCSSRPAASILPRSVIDFNHCFCFKPKQQSQYFVFSS